MGSDQIDGNPVVSESADRSTSSQVTFIANQRSTIGSQQIQNASNFDVHNDAVISQPIGNASQARCGQEAIDIERIKSVLQIRDVPCHTQITIFPD